ncbi:MAG: hypothetical protein ABSA92_14285 [Candidatus Bathyarchaeia archaeon]
MKHLLPLAAIEIFVWAALIMCIVIIGRVAFEISLGTATLVERIATQTVRLVISSAAVLLWLVSWKKITERYFWRAIGRSKTT